MDRGKAHPEPVRWLKVVTGVARIRYEQLRLATAEVTENFLCTQGGNAYIREPTSGEGCLPARHHPTPTGPVGLVTANFGEFYFHALG